MFQFAQIEYLRWLWLLLPGAVLLYWYYLWLIRHRRRLGDESIIGRLLRALSPGSQLLLGAAVLLAFALLVFAMANPQHGAKPEKAKQVGMDIVIAMDISRSMQAEDLRPSRLAQAKHLASRLTDGLAGGRVGLVVFAGNAYSQMPLTTDYSAAHMYINSISTDMAPTQGTAIGAAIQRAMDMFEASGPQPGANKKTARTIVLISDGENHESNAIAAAREAAKTGIYIYTIGAGKPEGAPIPLFNGSDRTDLLRDDNGNIVLSKLDEELLEKVARIAHGSYYNLARETSVPERITEQLGKLSKSERDVVIYTDHESYFQWLVGAAFILLAVAYVIEYLPLSRRSVSHE